MVRNGRLFFKYRYYLHENSEIIKKILYEFHDSQLGGHSEFHGTWKRIAKHFFWLNIWETILRCERMYHLSVNQSKQHKHYRFANVFANSIKYLEGRHYNCSIDFITDLPKVRGKSVIMVVVDKLSKLISNLYHPTLMLLK